MTAPDAVSWVCQNQTLVTALLSYLPIGAAASIFSEYYSKLPKWLQVLLHALALNLASAVAAAAKAAPPPPAQGPQS